ncbi:hypothetical protein BDW60DRAFT_201610 [Aspergillus nidulans var. acristatus]
MPQSICLCWQAGQSCHWRGALIAMIASMLYRPHRVVMVEQQVVFLQKPQHQEINLHPVNIQEIVSVAAFLGQATADGQGVEIQAVFC